ncbi:hypothetical protein TSMEX_002538 [Taenia solium]|eukprot:TsM_000362400 transcript=TsM_000362400 gene=TsM_000362400
MSSTVLCSKPHLFHKELEWSLLTVNSHQKLRNEGTSRTNIVEHTIDTSEARSIEQTEKCIPLPLLEEANSLVAQMIGGEVIKPSKSPWTSSITVAKKRNCSLLLCVNKKDANVVN